MLNLTSSVTKNLCRFDVSFIKRTLSSSSSRPYSIEEKKNYVIFKLNKPSTNSLNLEFLIQLNKEFDNLEKNNNINGVILTSNVKNIFSSGLDLYEMYQCKAERLTEFWRLMQEFWIRLYGSDKVYIAAINGHSPAAGCQLAMSCDYRVMAKGNYTIGISAVRLGILAPFWFRETMISTIGYRQAEKSLQLGLLYNPEEALNVKLVDEIVDQSDLLTIAEKRMQEWLKIPTNARIVTKDTMRESLLNKLVSKRDEDVDFFVKSTLKPSVQESLGKYLEALKNKNKNSK